MKWKLQNDTWNQTKRWSFEKEFAIDKLLAKVSNWERPNLWNQSWTENIITNSNEIQGFIENYFETNISQTCIICIM